MEVLELRRRFERTVAPLEIVGGNVGRRLVVQPGRFALDVARDRRGEAFVLRLGEGADVRWRFIVANAETARHHLLLLAVRTDRDMVPVSVARTRAERAAVAAMEPRRFLCGRDERHLFVAGLADRVTTVAAAMASLKPAVVVESELTHRVGAKARNRRKNAAFVRQGEWFFLPRPDFVPRAPAVVQHNEPISRGLGRMHLVEYLYREGSGERVWVCARYPQGVTEHTYRNLTRQNPDVKGWNWRPMVRTVSVFARGRVRHPDHATIYLPFWHLVIPNAEAGAGSAVQRSVAFLD